jgi:hypothetical protein
MNTNVNLSAPIGVMALLGTGFVFLLAALVLIQSVIVRKRRRAKLVLLAALVIAGSYPGAILIFSLASREKFLAHGDEKHFCEIDCHLAYSVVNRRQSRTLGNPPNQTTAKGVFTLVTIRTRFDETTIAPWRGDALLYPNGRALTLVDERGNKYSPSSEGQQALAAAQGFGQALTTPLRPGESYTTEIVFDLPPQAKASTLLVNEDAWETHLIIGHENSPMHAKTRFQL